MSDKVTNFSTFYTQSIKDRLKKTKKGKYKGQLKSVSSMRSNGLPSGPREFKPPGNPERMQDPSTSSFKLVG